MAEQLTMVVDWTVSVGNMIEIGVLAGSAGAAIIALRSTVKNMKNDLFDMKLEIKKVGEVLIKMAVHDQRFANLEQDVRDLKHGRGFIQPRSEGGVNGEWP